MNKVVLCILLLISSKIALSGDDYKFTVEDFNRYPIEGHGGRGVFEAKPEEGACLGMQDKVKWCSTVTRPYQVKNTILILGDSKAGFIFPGFVRNAKNSNLILIAAPSCPPLDNATFIEETDRLNLNKCEKLSQEIANAIKNNTEITHIFITFSQKSYERYKNSIKIDGILKESGGFELGFKNLIGKIESQNVKIIYFLDNPSLKDSMKCFPRSKRLELENSSPEGCVVEKSRYLEAVEPLMLLGRSVNKKNFKMVDAISELCPNNKCSVKLNDNYLYELTDHLNDYSNDIVTKKIVTMYKL